MDDWAQTFQQIGLYSLTVMAGLGVHAAVVLPLIYFIFTRKNPLVFLKGVSPALMTAFATASRYVDTVFHRDQFKALFIEH